MSQFCQNASGRDARLYYNTGTVPVPVWVEVTEAQDITMPWTTEEIENLERESDFVLFDSGPQRIEATFALTYRQGNTNARHFRDSLQSKCAWEYAIMSGDIATSGSEGIRAGMKTFSNSHNFPASGQSTVDIKLLPAYFEDAGSVGVGIPPSWYEVT